MRPTTSLVLAALLMGCGASGDAPAALPDSAAPPVSPVDAGADVAARDAGRSPDAGASDAGARRPLAVDRTDPKATAVTFKANVADPTATQSLGTQGAYVDTRVAPAGKLVVFLHGAAASAPASCTSAEVANMLTAKGFHVLLPCYNSYYGVGICGADIGGCRREAFEGKDLSPAIAIAPADAIEPRIVAALQYMMKQHPAGDWGYYLQDGQPYWPDIIISGISHGASSAGLIAKIRPVDRAVMHSGPLDTDQAWLALPSLTPPSRIYGFTHTSDVQHAGHLAAFQTLQLPGAAVSVDGAAAPYGGSHRLQTSAIPVPNTSDGGHSSTAPGGASPKVGGAYVHAAVWAAMYGR